LQRYHIRPDGLPPTNGYSQAVSFSGTMVAISGQVPLDADGNLVGPGDPRAQMRQVFDNLVLALAAAEAGIEDVVKLTIFLTDLADLPVYRQVRDDYINLERPPASSLIQVSALVHPGFRIELDALAAF
jgi:enamine deaminase RidA (YjgF/YER057c/UK114 family)